MLPDREAIWNEALKTAVQPEYVRKVGVKTVVELFRGPEPRVSLIRVHLQRGGGAVVSVDLTEQQLEAEAPLGAPLRDYVLGKADPGLFRYQVLTVRGGMRTPVYGMERGFHQPDHHHRGSGIAQQDVTAGIAGLPATASRLQVPDLPSVREGRQLRGSLFRARNRQHESGPAGLSPGNGSRGQPDHAAKALWDSRFPHSRRALGRGSALALIRKEHPAATVAPPVFRGGFLRLQPAANTGEMPARSCSNRYHFFRTGWAPRAS